jgi:hypothetical protein
MLGATDIARSVGVEIGALHAPMVHPSEGRVILVDYAPTAFLRAHLRHEGVSPSDVREVDVVWGDYKLREALGESVDYVLASHVIEHVPDMILWLLQVHEALKLGGILGLAIPDRRFTFDACRADSGFAEVAAAHLEGRRRPSLHQILDAAACSAATGSERDWRLEQGTAALPPSVLAGLPDLYRWLRTDLDLRHRYTDVHCWVFTPASFLALVEALAVIGCFAFVIEAFYPTEPGSIEFQVRLRAVGTGPDPAVQAGIERARQRLSGAG